MNTIGSTTRILVTPRRTHPVVILLCVILTFGCAVQSGNSRAFSRIGTIETDLQRGETTKADVLLLLGQPDGAGALGGFDALRGADNTATGPMDAWYYESVRASLMTGLKLHQNVLLVFFKGDIVDGFLWYDNLSEGQME